MIQPLTDLERFDLVKTMFPEQFDDHSDLGDEEDIIWDKFGVDPEQFDAIAGHLVMLAPVQQSPLSGEIHHVLGEIKIFEDRQLVTAAVKREATKS